LGPESPFHFSEIVVVSAGRRRRAVKRFSLIGAAVLGVALSAQAADCGQPVRVGGNVLLGFPVGDFRDNMDRVGSGLNGYVIVGLPRVPLSLGGSLGYMTQGSETIGQIQIGIWVGEMVTRNNVSMGHLFLRAQPRGAGLRPYVDALIGVKRLYTTTEIRIGFDVPNIDMNRDDWTISYGIGGGVSYEVYKSTGENPKDHEAPMGLEEPRGSRGRHPRDHGRSRSYSICIDLGAQYLIGGRAKYVDIDSVTLIEDRIWFNTVTSRTDMITAQIGASVLF
jgi:opacity protein-like surface antigen